MDIATLIGLVGGVLVVWQVGNPAVLYDGDALLVVLGGGIAATLVAFPFRDFWAALRATKNVLIVRPPQPPAMIERMVGYAVTARRDGILALEKPMADEPNLLLRAGIRLAVDGTEPALIMDILETEMHFVEERHKRNRRVLLRLGHHWALFGLVGGLLMMVQGGAVAAIAVPLLYGALLYGLVGGAFARKLGEYHDKEILGWKLVIEGVMAIQAGDNPRIVEHKLSVFLAPAERPHIDHPAPAPPTPSPDIAPAEIEAQRPRVIEVVREELHKGAGDDAQKQAIAGLLDRTETGDLGMVALLASLGGELYGKVMHRLQNPPKPQVGHPLALEHALDFDSFGAMGDEAIQVLMREVDQKDLVMALKGAGAPVREKFLGNMSARVRTFISEEIGFVRCAPEQVLDAQARIVMQLYQLVEQGKIQL